MMTPEEKITQLGLSLPPAPKPVGLYQPFVVAGKLAFLSGQVSKDAEGKILAGKVAQGQYTFDDAINVAREILFETPQSLCGMTPAPGKFKG